MRTTRTPSMSLAALAGAMWLTNALASDDDWKFSVTPYLWLPTFNATFKYSLPPSTGSPEVEVGPIDYLNKLDFLLMLAGEARKGDWSIFTDYINLDVSGGASHVKSVDFGGTLVGSSIDVGTQSSIKGYVWTLGGGYTVARSADTIMDVIGGVRYLGIDVSTDWHLSAAIVGPPPASLTFPLTGNVTERVDLWDAIVGVRGRINLDDARKWSVPYYVDIGTGSGSHTWQGLVGVDYAFGWGDLSLAYRHLSYDQKSDQLIQNLSCSGPIVGAIFRF